MKHLLTVIALLLIMGCEKNEKPEPVNLENDNISLLDQWAGSTEFSTPEDRYTNLALKGFIIEHDLNVGVVVN